MKIAVIGHGNVGGTLARRWAEAGYEVLVGVREQANKLASVKYISIHPIPEALENADVILVATPAHVTVELARAWKGMITGKILIDATNAVGNKPEPYRTGLEAFKAEGGIEDVVKCFNTTGFENMGDPVYEGRGIDMFVAGDSARGKQVATELAKAIGFEEVYDFGGDNKAELIEQFALSWINLAIMQGYGRNMGFKILKR